MARMFIRLLGSFQIDIDRIPIQNLESNKVRALLAYLVVERQQAHSREKLADMFWPGMTTKRANSNLSQALYNLRAAIKDHEADPPYLLRSRDTVQYNPKCNYWLDTEAFIEQLDEHQSTTQPDLGEFQETIDLYRGDFLEGLVFESSLAFDEWVLIQRQRFHRRALEGLYTLTKVFSEARDIASALLYAWRQVEFDPLDERAYRQLMRLLADSGQRNQALALFKRLQILLAEELNVTPEPETVALRDRIRDEIHTAEVDIPKKDNLPAFLTPLIGRKSEMAEIQVRCENPNCRLLTILGPGGSGKTRLALEVARVSRVAFQHGVCFVPLNPVQSPDSILPAIMEALDLPRSEQDDHQTQLSNYLRKKNLLLVLDGFEHLLEGASLIVDLLHDAPGVKILVTSRVLLKIKGENLYLLEGMHYPKDGRSDLEIQESDAVQLLVAGLQRTQPEFLPAAEDLSHLLEISRQVRGMPLGILLAASWGATLSLEEIAGMVSRNLDFLAADWTDVPTRQRSLRATFDHTWDLLNERERTIFQSLSVFRGAFTRRAAQIISDASPYELRNLLDRSLLLSKTPGWYEVHELLRQFGREKLAQTVQMEQSVCGSHSYYYLEQLASLGDDLKTENQVSALNSIDLEHENYRAAWNWAAEQGVDTKLLPAIEPICLYYDLRHRFSEGQSACQVAIEALPVDDSTPALSLLHLRLLILQSHFMRLSGMQDLANSQRMVCQSLLKKNSLSTAETRFEQALLLLELGDATFQSDYSIARGYYLRSIELFQTLEQTWWTLRAHLQKALCDLRVGDFGTAQIVLEQTLTRQLPHSDPRSRAKALSLLAYLHVRQGQMEQALQEMEEAAAVYQSIGDRTAIADSLTDLGTILGWYGRYQESIRLMKQSHSICQELGNDSLLTFTYMVIGMMCALDGSYLEAKKWAMKSLAQARDFDLRREIAASLLILGWVALGEGEFQRAKATLQESVAEYRLINFQDELGWALAALGQTELVLGEALTGLAFVVESLEIGKQIRATMTIYQALGPGAQWITRQGDPAWGLELYTLARQHPGLRNSRWFDDVYGYHINAMAEGLSEDEIHIAQEHGRESNLWSTTDKLLDKLSKILESPIPVLTVS